MSVSHRDIDREYMNKLSGSEPKQNETVLLEADDRYPPNINVSIPLVKGYTLTVVITVAAETESSH